MVGKLVNAYWLLSLIGLLQPHAEIRVFKLRGVEKAENDSQAIWY